MVLYRHFGIPTVAEHFVLKDNVFRNWQLLNNSIQTGFYLGTNAGICNNLFINADGTHTVVSLNCNPIS